MQQDVSSIDAAKRSAGDEEWPAATEEELILEGEDKELEPAEARLYRGVAARLNYIAPDRADIAFAVKEAARVKPTGSSRSSRSRCNRNGSSPPTSPERRASQTNSKTLNTQTPELDAALAQWEKVQVSWTVLQPAKVEAINGTELKTQKDYSILASGKTPEKDTYTLTLKNVPEGARAFRIEVMPDKTLPKKGPGRAGNGNFVITEVILKADGNSIPLQNATASFEQTHAGDKNPYKKWNALSAIDGDAKGAEFGWAVLPQVGKNNRLLFEAKEALKGQKQITFVLKQDHGTKHTLGRFQISATTHEGKITANASAPPKNIGDILAIAPAKRNANQKDVLAAHYRSIAPELAQARKVLGEVQGQVDRKQKSFPTTLVSTSMAKPRMVRILPRGNWLDDSGPEVKPAVPGYLKLGKPVEGLATRTDLAGWITSKN